MGRLADKIAVVVGAGQTPGETIGNGRAVSIRFAEEGAKLILVARSTEGLEGTDNLVRAAGGEATLVPLDLIDGAGIDRLGATPAVLYLPIGAESDFKGLVDLVVPMSSGYLDMTADVEVFVALARRTSCKVAGGLEYYVRGYMKPGQRGITQASIQMLRAAAASFWERGVDAIYLFNYDCHRLLAKASQFGGILQDYTDEEVAFLKHALDPADAFQQVHGHQREGITS